LAKSAQKECSYCVHNQESLFAQLSKSVQIIPGSLVV